MKLIHHKDDKKITIGEKSYDLRLVRLLHPHYDLPENITSRYYSPLENKHYIIANGSFQINRPIPWTEGEFLMSRLHDLDKLTRMPLEDIQFLEEQQKKNLHTMDHLGA